MIAKVIVDISLDREFDYIVPPELAGNVQVGSRVQALLKLHKRAQELLECGQFTGNGFTHPGVDLLEIIKLVPVVFPLEMVFSIRASSSAIVSLMLIHHLSMPTDIIRVFRRDFFQLHDIQRKAANSLSLT